MVEDNLKDKRLERDHTALRADPTRWRNSLVARLEDVNAQLTSRAAELETKRAECLAMGEGGKQPFYTAKAGYLTWKGSAVCYKQRLERRLREVKVLLKSDNVAESEAQREAWGRSEMARLQAIEAAARAGAEDPRVYTDEGCARVGELCEAILAGRNPQPKEDP
jgi:hypothetical protein